jgi:hypothetical protein
MLIGKNRTSLLIAAASAVSFGLIGASRASIITTVVSVPLTASDGTPANNQIQYGVAANGAAYLPTIQTNLSLANPNGSSQGAGTAFLVGTLNEAIGTSAHSSSSTMTAFAYSPTTPFTLFGQYDPTTTAMYQNTAQTTSYNGITNQPLYQHNASIAGVGAGGDVAAYEGIQATDNANLSPLGQHAFKYNIFSGNYTSLGLTGIDSTGAAFAFPFTYTNTSSNVVTATYSTSQSTNVDNQGDTIGTTARDYNFGGTVQSSSSVSGALGTSVWFNSPGTGTIQVGMTTSGYTYQKTVTGVGVTTGTTGTYIANSAYGVRNGFGIGTVTPYLDNGNGTGASLGTDGWEYSSTANSNTALGLYFSNLTPIVAGTTYSYSYPVTGTLTTGSGRSSQLKALNNVGQVGGTSPYYAGTSSSKGTDAWIYTPGASQPYQQVGLISNGFPAGTSSFVSTTGGRTSAIQFLNNSGASTGTSTEYLSSAPNYTGNTTTVTIPWFTPAGGTAQAIGLTDTNHTYVNTTTSLSYQSNFISELTDSGLVGGTSTRYIPGTTTTEGSDAWIWNSKTNNYTILDPSTAAPSATNYFSSSISYLNEAGDAVGTFTNASGGQSYAFLYTPQSGFVDLTNSSAISAELAAYPGGPAILTSAFSIDEAGHTIYANLATQNPITLAYSNSAIVALAVPEPATVSLLTAFGATVALRRRRRSSAC